MDVVHTAVTRDDLARVRDWAHARIASGAEPPSAFDALVSARSALDYLIRGLDHSFTPPGVVARGGPDLKVVD